MKNSIFYVFITCLLLVGCGSSDSDVFDSNTTNNTPDENSNDGGVNYSNWSIPIEDVKDGGPGKDGIPSIDSPKFAFANDPNAAYLNEDDLVVGLVIGDVVKAYPHLVLDWHEIVNDKVGIENITISFCPLTGTGFGWKSKVDGFDSTFGVSGLLYNANLILYDRKTDSNWSQLGLECVNGSQIGDRPELVHVVETTWSIWKLMYPNTEVMTLDTGFERSYNLYPYGPYKIQDDFFIFPVSPRNDALPNKERVLALIDGGLSKVYQFEKFGNGMVVKQEFNSKNYLIVGAKDFMVAFELKGSLKDLTFDYKFESYREESSIFTDNEGNKWSVFGEAISGPRKGVRLEPTKSVISYWFAIAAFYPNPQIY